MLSAAFLAVCFAQSGTAAEPTVKLTQKDSNVEVSIDATPFTVLNFAKDQRKPYFHPVNGPDGTFISRPLENPKDHPHHKGLWFSVDEVNKSRHWMERSQIQPVEVKILQAEGNPAKLEMTSTWKADDGRDLLTEKTTVSIFANRLIIYYAILKAEKEPVEFEDTKEGMFALRFRDELREKVGAHVSNADGLQTTQECWGKESDLVDYYGTVEDKTVGVALFDHPLNFHRSRYPVRDYGLFAANHFELHDLKGTEELEGAFRLAAGESITLRYRVIFHRGNQDDAKLAQAFERYAAEP